MHFPLLDGIIDFDYQAIKGGIFRYRIFASK